MPRNKRKYYIAIIIIVLLAAAYAGYRVFTGMMYSAEADRILDQMYTLVPGLGNDSGISTGAGREQLAAVSIDGKDIVGCLEIPALDMMLPVTTEGSETKGLAAHVSGSPAGRDLRLRGGSSDIFRDIDNLKPGDNVTFTDMDGVRYSYTVTTQYHLKDWDEGDNDLLLGRRSDGETEFIVGCTSV